jgi:hypothetical protein
MHLRLALQKLVHTQDWHTITAMPRVWHMQLSTGDTLHSPIYEAPEMHVLVHAHTRRPSKEKRLMLSMR